MVGCARCNHELATSYLELAAYRLPDRTDGVDDGGAGRVGCKCRQRIGCGIKTPLGTPYRRLSCQRPSCEPDSRR
jgi:hypothetical protein